MASDSPLLTGGRILPLLEKRGLRVRCPCRHPNAI
jgi:hypothetical protein